MFEWIVFILAGNIYIVLHICNICNLYVINIPYAFQFHFEYV